MECHSIQFTTISINVERGIVKILFKYRYFQDLLIDIDIDIDISQILLIDIDIFGIALSISIFFRIALSISIFFKSVDISTIDIDILSKKHVKTLISAEKDGFFTQNVLIDIDIDIDIF